MDRKRFTIALMTRSLPASVYAAALMALPLVAMTSFAAQGLPDAADLARRTETAFAQHHSIQYVREITGEVRKDGQPVTSVNANGRTISVSSAIGRQSVSYVNPGKARVEIQAGGAQNLVVSDGNTVWTYRPRDQEYTKITAARGPEGIAAELDVLEVLGFFVDRKSLVTQGSATIAVNGRSYDCWVTTGSVRIPPQAAMGGQVYGGKLTSLIDKQLFIPIQETVEYSYKVPPTPGAAPVEYIAKLIQTTRTLYVDELVPDELFAFTPPPGSHEQVTQTASNASSSSSGRVDFTGKAAPSFSLVALDGKTYSLDSLKGKTVLLDFWATWCGPCKKSMPTLEKINKDYGPRGLVVLGVDIGEPRATVQTFLKSNPMPYPVIIGSESGIQSAYSIRVFPTYVLIGPDGKVQAQNFGFNEASLTGLVAKSGLNRMALLTR